MAVGISNKKLENLTFGSETNLYLTFLTVRIFTYLYSLSVVCVGSFHIAYVSFSVIHVCEFIFLSVNDIINAIAIICEIACFITDTTESFTTHNTKSNHHDISDRYCYLHFKSKENVF